MEKLGMTPAQWLERKYQRDIPLSAMKIDG
jgi:hypothetical protein